jgi:UV DNA damage endonuclease
MTRIGYACLALGVKNTQFNGCLLKNAGLPRLTELIGHNLDSLENMIDYNTTNGIMLYRISSGLIPFGSRRGLDLPWEDIFRDRLSGSEKDHAADGGFHASGSNGVKSLIRKLLKAREGPFLHARVSTPSALTAD